MKVLKESSVDGSKYFDKDNVLLLLKDFEQIFELLRTSDFVDQPTKQLIAENSRKGIGPINYEDDFKLFSDEDDEIVLERDEAITDNGFLIVTRPHPD